MYKRQNPYRVLEGALIAAYAVSSPRVVVAMKGSFEHELKRVRSAIDEFQANKVATDVNITVVEGPDSYLFGEETGLLEVIDGRGPFPRVAPPYRRGIEPQDRNRERNMASNVQLATETGSAESPALANLHRIPAGAAPPELDRLSTRDTFGDYCDRLTSSLDQLPDPHPAIRLGVEWLRRHRPWMPPRQAIVHADFRNGNLLVDQGRLSAVLDWELAHVGDPMEDLAYLCLRTWRFGNDHLTVGGFGSLEALRGAYEAGGGDWRHDAFRWWLAARTAWWACGLAAQAAAFSAGMSDSIVLAAGGRRVVELEDDLLNLIDPAVPEECF